MNDTLALVWIIGRRRGAWEEAMNRRFSCVGDE